MRKAMLPIFAVVALAMALPVSASCYKCTYVLFNGYTCEATKSGYDSCTKSPTANYCKMGNAMCGSSCGTGSGCTPDQKDVVMAPDPDHAEAVALLASSPNEVSIMRVGSGCGYVVE